MMDSLYLASGESGGGGGESRDSPSYDYVSSTFSTLISAGNMSSTIINGEDYNSPYHHLSLSSPSSNEESTSLSSSGEIGSDLEVVQFSLPFQLLIYALYNLVFVAAVLGNTLVIYVVVSSPRMRTVTNYLIANLAASDALMALLCVPFSYIPVLLQYWPFGEILCYVLSPAQAISVFVSAYTLIALAIDRYVAILYPLKPRLRRSQALLVIAAVWIIAIITATPIAVFTRLEIDPERGLPLCQESGWPDEMLRLAYSLTLMILQYFFPIAVLIFTYSRIVCEVWGKRTPGEAEQGRDQRFAKAKRKTVTQTLVVISAFALAWSPLTMLMLYLETLHNSSPIPYIEYWFFACHWPAMAHTIFNPICYWCLNDKFRSAFSQILHRCRGTIIVLNRDKSCTTNGTTTNGTSDKWTRTTLLDNQSNKNGCLKNGNGPGATTLLMIKMMMTVVVVYSVSWMPFNVLTIFLTMAPLTHPIFSDSNQLILAHVYFFIHLLAMSHSIFNFCIYTCFNPRYREGFSNATRWLPCMSELFGRGLGLGGGGDGYYNQPSQVSQQFRLQRTGTCTTYTFGNRNTVNNNESTSRRGNSTNRTQDHQVMMSSSNRHHHRNGGNSSSNSNSGNGDGRNNKSNNLEESFI